MGSHGADPWDVSAGVAPASMRIHGTAGPRPVIYRTAYELGVHRDPLRLDPPGEGGVRQGPRPADQHLPRDVGAFRIPGAAVDTEEPSHKALARSLSALPEGSLSGFLLRTSYRLERTPSRVALLSGLMDSQKRLPTQHLLELSTPTLEHFSTIMRLTRDESTGMTLLGLQDHVPTFTDLWSVAQYGRDRPGTSSWAVAYSSRYCPECLRGDGTPVQDMLGGAWRLPWYLPVVFACPTHPRLLECFCPSCHSVPNGRASGRPRSMPKPGPRPADGIGVVGKALRGAARRGELNARHQPVPARSRSTARLAGAPGAAVDGQTIGPLGDEADEGFYLPELVVAAELIVLS